MRILFLILFFPIFCFAETDRVISFEWEKVSGATSYEVVFSTKTFNKSFKIKENSSDFKLPPGSYQVKIRSLDSRKVPGPWSPSENLIVNHPSPKVSYQEKNYKPVVLIELENKFDKMEVKTGSESTTYNSAKANISLTPGKHELTIVAFKNQIPSDPKTISIEAFSNKLDDPKPSYFNNKIIWPKISLAKEYLIVIDGKKQVSKENEVSINPDIMQSVEIQSVGESIYYPSSNKVKFIYDPLKEKYFSLPKNLIYLSYQTGTYEYKNSNYPTNSTVDFNNISSLGSIGYSYQKRFGIDLQLNFGSFMVDNKNYITNDAQISGKYLYELSVRNKLLFSLSQNFSEQYSFYSQQSFLSSEKNNYSFISVAVENQYVLDQRFMVKSKIQVGENLFNPELSLLYKLSTSYFGSVGLVHKKNKFDTIEVQNNFLMLNLFYGWN